MAPISSPNLGTPTCMDIVDVYNVDLEKFLVLNLVDLGTRFQHAVLIDDNASRTIIDTIETHWVSWAGYPRAVRADQGGDFRSNVFRDWLYRNSISLELTGTESPWQHSVVEMGLAPCSENRVVQEQVVIWAGQSMEVPS